MNSASNPPAGWSASYFQSVCADVASWTWGTVQGAFNEKASVTQIIVDAVIGMIPLVGDATAVRDLLAVVIGLADDDEKRHSTSQWVLLVILLFALIPVFGGVVKGVGRLTMKVAQETAHLAGPARKLQFEQGANEIIEFLNRIGIKHAERWLLSLRIDSHVSQLVGKFTCLIQTLDTILAKSSTRLIDLVPGLARRIDSLRNGLARVREAGSNMIPKAIKELDQQLRDIQAFIRSGGENTSRLALHEIATGQRITTRAEERRLIEDGVLPERNSRGGFSQNPDSPRHKAEIDKIYRPEPDFPNLLTLDPVSQKYNNIGAFSGKMTNRRLNDGEEIYRFFGSETTTHGVKVGETSCAGAWWGLGKPPRTAKEWRELAAVLDSFNGDGYLVTAKVTGNKGPKAVVGTVSEQYGERIPGQYLPGGTTQAFFFLDKNFSDTLRQAGREFIRDGVARKIVEPATGIEFSFHITGWKDANGIWGYIRPPGTGSIQTARVAAHEQASKQNEQVIIQP